MALWLPTFWMMRVSSRAFSYWLPSGLAAWGDPVILSALTVLGLAVIAQRTHRLSFVIHENRAFLLFFIFTSASVLWTDDVFDAFKRWFRLVGDVTMALIILTEVNPFAAMLCVMRRAILLLIPLSLVLSLYFPFFGIGEGGSWIGVTVDKNWLGLVCFVASAYLLWNWTMRKRQPDLAAHLRLAGVPFEIPYLALSLYILWGGAAGLRSSTAIVLLALAVGFFHLMDCVRKNIVKLGPTTAVFAFLLLFGQVLPQLTGHRSLKEHIIEDVLHKDVNLTDRAEFWPLLLKKGMAHPWLGSGFDSFFTPQMQDEIYTELAAQQTYFRPNQAHNGYIQVFLNLGVVGVLLLGATIIAAFKGIKKLLPRDFEFGRFRLILLVCTLVSNYTEATFARPTEYVWFLFLLAAFNPGRLATEAPAVEDAADAAPFISPLACAAHEGATRRTSGAYQEQRA